jgi:hypothetical protein
VNAVTQMMQQGVEFVRKPAARCALHVAHLHASRSLRDAPASRTNFEGHAARRSMPARSLREQKFASSSQDLDSTSRSLTFAP